MIEELPELQRSAIVSFYYDHMKIEEIAKIFDCSVNTIKSRLNYAKKFLKSKVEEHQKTYSYKLFSFSPAILLLALRELLSSEKYTMAPEAAEKVYHVACETLGITASSIALGAATSSSAASGAAGVATGAETIGAETGVSATGTAATATATTAKGAGLWGKFMAFSAAKKAGTIILATTLVGGGATTGVLLTIQNTEPPAVVVETEQDVPDIAAALAITEEPKEKLEQKLEDVTKETNNDSAEHLEQEAVNPPTRTVIQHVQKNYPGTSIGEDIILRGVTLTGQKVLIGNLASFTVSDDWILFDPDRGNRTGFYKDKNAPAESWAYLIFSYDTLLTDTSFSSWLELEKSIISTLDMVHGSSSETISNLCYINVNGYDGYYYEIERTDTTIADSIYFQFYMNGYTFTVSVGYLDTVNPTVKEAAIASAMEIIRTLTPLN